MTMWHYIQGIHALRVTYSEDEEDFQIIEKCERYDPYKGELVMDFSMMKRINDDMSCQKIPEYDFWAYCEAQKKQKEAVNDS